MFYRPAKADNETAEYIEKCLSWKSGFAQSKTAHTQGESQGESETRRPLMTANEIKLIDKTQVFVEMEGEKKGIPSILAERLDHRKIPELAGRLHMKPPEVSLLPELDLSVDRQDVTDRRERRSVPVLPDGYPLSRRDHHNHHESKSNTLWHRERKLPNGYVDPDKRY